MEQPNLAMIPSGYKARVVYSIMPENGVGDFTFVRSGDATRINKDGLIETVDSHVPRLNYDLVNGVPSECPSLLLEPQSTNLLTYSEDFSDSSWTSQAVGATVTSNSIISPDGTLNADTIQGSGSSTFVHIRKNINLTTASHTFSIFAKKGTNNFLAVQAQYYSGATNTAVIFDLNNSIVTSGTGNIEDYGNEWLKCSYTVVISSDLTGRFLIGPAYNGTTIEFPSTSTANGKNIYIYGAQLEQGSYPTSYIPTSGLSVTRSAEACNSAGNASTFNSEQGILFAEFSALANDGTYRAIYINDNAATRYVGLRYSNNANQIQAISFDGSNLGFIAHTLSNATAFSKFAVKFGATGISLYIDGSLIGSDATFTGIASNELDELLFNSNSGTQAFYGKCKDLRYYDTEGMTDTEINNLLTQLTQ